MSELSNELTNDTLENSLVESETEIQEDSVIEENNEIKEANNHEIVNEEVPIKGEDIYVENDVEVLERMLGIPSSEMDENDSEEQEDNNEELKDDENCNMDTLNDSDLCDNTEVVEETKKSVRLSDFMDECRDDFTYLTHANGSFNIISLPIVARKEIKNAVKSQHYIFRYPKFVLREPVLGFSEHKITTDDIINVVYTVYFPESRLTFMVPVEYVKPYSTSFKEYFEDLVTRIRPENMVLDLYNDASIITSIKVIETGIIEVVENGETKQFILNNNHISFYEVLAYIRELSDLGEDTLTLKLIPAYFSLL